MPDPINGAVTGGGIPSPAPVSTPEPSAAPYTPPSQPQFSPPSSTQFGSAPTPGSFPAPQPQYQPQPQQPQYPAQPGYAPQPQSSVIRDALAQRGYDVSHFQSDDEVVNAFGEAYPIIDAWPQVMQNARAGMQYREHQAEFEQWLASRQQPAPQPQAPEKKSWEAPPLDPKWASHVRWDAESGQYVPRDMLSSPVAVEGMNRRAEWQRDQQQKFWDNPYDFIEQGLKPRFESMLAQTKQEAIAEWQAQQREQSVRADTEQWLQQNAQYFYAMDAQGNALTDPRTGEMALTPVGQTFQAYCYKVREMGVTDPIHVRNLAMGMTQRDIAAYYSQQSAQQPQAPVGVPPAQGAPTGLPQPQNGAPPRGPDGKFIPASATQPPQQPAFPMTAGQRSQAQIDAYTQRANGAMRQPNYGNSEFAAAAAQAPQNPNATFGEMAIAELRNRGAVPHTG